jgi:hypothetical protein
MPPSLEAAAKEQVRVRTRRLKRLLWRPRCWLTRARARTTQARQDAAHKERMRTAKSCIDNKPPPTFNHIGGNNSKKQTLDAGTGGAFCGAVDAHTHANPGIALARPCVRLAVDLPASRCATRLTRA